jgi:hypothetical protein
MRYMLITFYRKPGGQIDEHVTVSKRCKPADLQTSNIILDFAQQKIDKCVVEGKKLDKAFNELKEYYRKIYPGLVAQLEKEAPITVKEKSK